MATPQLSPGVIVREVDLTVGRAENVLDNIGAIAGPFPIGPVDEPITISTQQELINTFGKPLSTDRQYEYWMSASSFLTYGGILKVARTSGSTLNNANAGTDEAADTSLLIKNKDDYELNFSESTDFNWATRNPGSWGTNLKVCVIDNLADQTIGISTNNLQAAGVTVGAAVTSSRISLTIPQAGFTTTFTGVVKGIVVGVNTDTVNQNSTFDVKITDRVENDTNTYTEQLATNVSIGITLGPGVNGLTTTRVYLDDLTGVEADQYLTVDNTLYTESPNTQGLFNNRITSVGGTFVDVATAVTYDQTLSSTTLAQEITNTEVTAGITTVFVADGSGIRTGDYLIGVGFDKIYVAGAGSTAITINGAAGLGTDTSVGAAVTFNRVGVYTGASATISSLETTPGAVTPITYQEYNSAASFLTGNQLLLSDSAGLSTGSQLTVASAKDWYNEQTLGLTNSTVFWKSLAPKPIDGNYSSSRSGGNDAIHVVVVDDLGDVTGIQGNILEKNLNLSKALDATADGDNPVKTYYKDYITNNSQYVFAGKNPSMSRDTYWGTEPISVGFSTGNVAITTAAGLWGQEAQGVTFSGLGNVTYNLTAGVDYTASGGMSASLGDLNTSYNLFANKDDEEVDYLLMGPGLSEEAESQAKANLLISLAEGRKDCMAVVSPHRANVVNVSNTNTQTQNVLSFYSPVSSSSYAVLDSGYKYTFDRFNNKFVYIPTNGDVAGLMVRTSIDSFPWFSPAGLQRGVINNAVKLAYNPDKAQRDLLYAQRINPVVTKKGAGTLLFGDKTALGYASAFDRINVRRLFLTVEQALESASESTLFEINDANTRSNFVNIVEPYLRDVQAKRGVTDFLVVCDETNNTPDVIDNNEFRADIFLQPSKSINFITLTFVATRTGIDFAEVVGTV